jgi:DNA uptake protein ComE-like DNA-binding protein
MAVNNQDVRTTLETVYKVTGIDSVDQQTAALAAYSAQLEAVIERLAKASKAEQDAFAVKRRIAAQEGAALPRQTQELFEKVIIQKADPRNSVEEQSIMVRAMVRERMPQEIKKAAASLSRRRSFFARTGDEDLGLDPAAGGFFTPGSAGYQKIQDLRQEIQSGDAFRVADAAAPIEFIQRSKFKFSRMAAGLGGRAVQAAAAGVQADLNAGRFEAAKAKLDAATEQSRIQQELDRNRDIEETRAIDARKVRGDLGSFQEKITALKTAGVQDSALRAAIGLYTPALQEVEAFETGAKETLSKPFVKNQLQLAAEALKPAEEIAELFKNTGEGLKELEKRVAQLGNAMGAAATKTMRDQFGLAKGFMPSVPVRGRAVNITGIDVNKATLAELQNIPGVTPMLATHIDAYRSAAGGFADTADFLGKFTDVAAAQSALGRLPAIPGEPVAPKSLPMPSRQALPTGLAAVAELKKIVESRQAIGLVGASKKEIDQAFAFFEKQAGVFGPGVLDAFSKMSRSDVMKLFAASSGVHGKAQGLIPDAQFAASELLKGVDAKYQADLTARNAAEAAAQAAYNKAKTDRANIEQQHTAAKTALAQAQDDEKKRAEGANVQDMDEAVAQKALSENMVENAEAKVQEQIAKLNQSSKDMKASARREQLEKRFKYSPKGRAAVKRMLEAETAMEGAVGSGATLEAGLRQAEMLNAQAELETIEREQNRGRYQRLGVIRAVSHLATGLTSAGSNIVANDIGGLSTSMFSVPQAGFGLMRDLAIPHLVTKGFTGGAGLAFAGGLLGAGALAVGSAAYSRGAAFLDRGQAAMAETVPQFEALFGKYPEMLATDERQQAINYLAANRHKSEADLALSTIESTKTREEALKLAADRAANAPFFASAEEDALALTRSAFEPSAARAAGHAETTRRTLIDQIFSEYGAEGTIQKANITQKDVMAVVGASAGRGIGTEFMNMIPGATGSKLPGELGRAAAAAAFARSRGLSIESVGRLSSMGPRFGARGTESTYGLAGPSGFGFFGEARDQFTDRVSSELMQAGMSGMSLNMGERNRFYQGALNAGANPERLSNDYLRSMNAMSSRVRGLSAGAEGFVENMGLIKALKEGKSFREARRLIRTEAPGYTPGELEKHAYGVNKFLYEESQAGMLTDEDIAAKIRGFENPAQPGQVPLTPESLAAAAAPARAEQAMAETAPGTAEAVDMAAVSTKFDAATATFAKAVRQFAYSVFT